MAKIEIVHDDASLRLGVSRNLLVPVWLGSPEVVHMRILGRALHGIVGRYGASFAWFDVIVSGKPVFSDAVRDELVKILKDPRHQALATAHVVMIPGLTGAAVRAFLSTVSLLGRVRWPDKTFSEPRVASQWIAPILNQNGREAWSSDQVLAAQAEVTQRLASTG
jgi:hypothetical protein